MSQPELEVCLCLCLLITILRCCVLMMVKIYTFTLGANLNSVLPWRPSLAWGDGGGRGKEECVRVRMFLCRCMVCMCSQVEQAFGLYGMATLLTYAPPTSPGGEQQAGRYSEYPPHTLMHMYMCMRAYIWANYTSKHMLIILCLHVRKDEALKKEQCQMTAT